MVTASALLASCGAAGSKKADSTDGKAAVETKSDVIAEGVVKVYSFHTNKRCITCQSIEKLTREVVAEMANDKIELEVINISDSWNEKIADKYEVTWSSLVLDNGKQANNLTEMAFAYAKNKPEEFKKNLKDQITKQLQ